jgi:phage replication-related protein YjqB (UPF0714/DUF867 family)
MLPWLADILPKWAGTPAGVPSAGSGEGGRTDGRSLIAPGPGIIEIASRGFAYAVAFHGFSEEDVLVGGGAAPGLKLEIAAAVQQVVGSAIPVRVATPADNYDGDSPSNIVNRLTPGGVNGVQIEQSLEAREKFWKPIADAVAAVFSGKLQHYSNGKVE